VVGSNAANGVFVGRLFLHPDLDAAVEMPDAWTTANSPEAARAVAPGETAVVFLHVVGRGDDPVDGARADGLTDTQIQRVRRLQVSQLPAAALAASTRDGTRVALTWIVHRDRIFRVTGVCEADGWERYRAEFERTAMSFRPLRPEDLARITESRLRIRAARAGESLAQVLARGGATWTPAQAAVANGVATDGRLERDWPVKVAVSERYRPAGGQTPAPR
jgi:predicted Zn-dependent protease